MRFISFPLLVFTLHSCLSLYADKIRVFNQTNEPLFVRVYYQKNDESSANSAENIMRIPPKSFTFMERPERKSYQTIPLRHDDRNLLAAHTDRMLAENLTAYEVRNLTKINVGDFKGKTFYLTLHNNKLTGYNETEWKVIRPTEQVIGALGKTAAHYTSDQIKKQIRDTYKASKNNPYKHQKATVSVGNRLSEAEKKYIAHRQGIVKKALEALLQRPLDDDEYIPRIACVFSGGGYRAMVSTLGTLNGLENAGLIDAVMWNVGLSGSTWALGSWLVSGQPIQAWSNTLYDRIGKHISKIGPKEAQLVANALLVKWAYDQPITIVDVYGALLSTIFFSDKGDDRQRVYLSAEAHKIIENGLPLPIFAAIQTGSGDAVPRWYEFSPYQIGSVELGMYVEPWAFGRQFVAGNSQDFAPEQTVGFFMGIFGSAFAAPYQQIYQEIMAGIKDESTKKIVQVIFNGIEKVVGKEKIETTAQKRVKFSWAAVNNFTFGMRQSPINNQEYIRLSDAGIAFNLPYPPVSGERPERKADIIILCDYSSGIHTASSLHDIDDYARSKGLPLPKIDYAQAIKRAVSVFKDTANPEAPVVIYIPLIRDQSLLNLHKKSKQFQRYVDVLANFDPVVCTEKSFCSTTNLEYTKQQAEQLTAHNSFVIEANKEAIVQEIAWVIDKKSKK